MRRTLVFLASAVLVVLLVVAMPGARALVCESSWSKIPSPDQLDNPRAITPVANGDAWVVGSKKTRARDVATGAAHWNGTSWSLVSTPNAGAGFNALLGVDAVASRNVWAVGYAYTDVPNNNYETLAERWNGSQWQVVPSPNAGTSPFNNTLTDVDALSATNVWAVGSYRTDNSRKTLIEQWNGSSWRIVPSPNPAILSNSLLGVAAVGPDDVWAVGWKSSPNGLRSLLLHRGTAGWEEVAVPAFGTGDNVLTSISAVGANDVWATGYYVDGTKHEPLTLRYNGTSWSRVPSINGGDGTTILEDVYFASPSDAWAVGLNYRADLHHYVAWTQHWDGSTWSAVPSAISSSLTDHNEMFSVAKEPSSSRWWAVGSPSDVETICGSAALSATSLTQEKTGTPTRSLAQAPEQQLSSVLPSASDTSATTITSGTPVMAVNKAADAGIAEDTTTYGAVIFDFNNDGSSDIFLGRHFLQARLYKNLGDGHFTEIDQGTFGEIDRHGCDAADVNGDGLKDIFCSRGAAHQTLPKGNELYIQRPDHTFAEQAAQRGVLDPYGRGRLGAFIDANGDSLPDLFVGNDVNRGDAMPSPNRFFINGGGGTYRYAPEYGLEREMRVHEDNSDVKVGDLDNDGWRDLLLAVPSGLRAYHNDQGKGFTDVAASVGLGQSPKDVTLANVNGDSWPDVIGVSGGGLRVMLNTGGTFSSAFTTSLQYGTDVAAGDVNGDNRDDIYVMRGADRFGINAPDQVYLNNGDGRGFTRMSSIPSTRGGQADSVEPIDYDQNGLTDFLALNGGEGGSGQVQLIAFFPAS